MFTRNNATDLSIIIPVYQTVELLKKSLPELNNYLAALPIITEVLIVDDGSDDADACRNTALANKAVYLSNPTNRGKGAAVRLGMMKASGRWRIFTDADLPYYLEAIESSLSLLGNPHDLVVGDRTLADSSYFDKIPVLRRYSSRLFSLLVRSLVLKENYDTQCGFKAFTADAATEIFSRTKVDRFATDVEILGIAHLRKYSIGRLPVRLRHWQTSGISVVRDSLRMLYDLTRIRYFLATGAYN
ncbi:MAG: glycosyltransferase [Anaerolineales bacterium]